MTSLDRDDVRTTDKPVILTFVRYYLPGFKSGGPVRTIANMVDMLGDEFEFRIVTTDRDMLDIAPYENIKVEEWYRVGKAWVYYVSAGTESLTKWKKLTSETQCSVFYLNSLYDPIYTLLPLVAVKLCGLSEKPIIIAPRGELSPGAMAIKGWKKKPFLLAARVLGFYRNVRWHTSTEEEAFQVRKKMGSVVRLTVARDLPARVPKAVRDSDQTRPEGPLRIVFLSRISRMKNLDYALKLLSKTLVDVQFDIWGTLEDQGYWKLCEKLIDSMPGNVAVRYRGVADNSVVVNLLAEYDLLFLPTLGENYGHVIAESVSAGTPILISDQTPWRGLAELGVGWDIPLDAEDLFIQAIGEAEVRVNTERSAWRKTVSEYAHLKLTDPATLYENRQLFLKAIS